MHTYLETHEWKIIERGFNQENIERSEAIFSIGNGRMGQRANFEETYSGKSLQGSYVAGVYYPDKTRVGWWKNGYPEYFAKVLNSCNWIGIEIRIEDEILDLNKCEVLDFYRELDMQQGLLTRRFKARLKDGKELEVEAIRFTSVARDEIGAIKYSITPLNFSSKATLTPYLDFDVQNKDSNYDEKFWEHISSSVGRQKAALTARTKKLDFHVSVGMEYNWSQGNNQIELHPSHIEHSKFVANQFDVELVENLQSTLYKYVGVLASLNHSAADIQGAAEQRAAEAKSLGFYKLLEEHKAKWAKKWEMSDIRIEGDAAAQQGIRFNIFHLDQTYTGEDSRLNIGPKGFTGEKYGGSTYWDTEAYCLPFYLSTAESKVAKNLLTYRYKQLNKAIENAQKLGFTHGAALYPMVTMNGEECHNEWEITFEEIHRNGAIAFAIYNFIRHTQDSSYLLEGGLEVLVGIARFWHQRFHFSEDKKMFVMHGVTGPNEYENNINNNWYTSYIAQWCLRYTAECTAWMKEKHPSVFDEISKKISLSIEETNHWLEQSNAIYFPEDKNRGVFLQQDGFLDKELRKASSLNPAERPINQHWSWDRILRSCFIKQADVLQGLYFFEEDFDLATLERNFDFYEPMTVHESSLSPCVHSIQAARLGRMEKAYEMYLRTSRLDLDDYNNEVAEGLHITSMAGTWMSVVQGFGGMSWKESEVHFWPRIPSQWQSYSFTIRFRGANIRITANKSETVLEHLGGSNVEMHVYGSRLKLSQGSRERLSNPNS